MFNKKIFGFLLEDPNTGNSISEWFRPCTFLIFSFTFLSLPIIIAIKFLWRQYSTIWQQPQNCENALIVIATVGGVLWSGAIITYSIHPSNKTKLRTALHIIQYTFIAPIIGLLSEGALLRTAFYLMACFYAFLALNSFILEKCLSTMEFFSTFFSQKKMKYTNKNSDNFWRRMLENSFYITSGLRHFIFVSILCFITFVLGRQDFIAWSCITIFIISWPLIFEELFQFNDSIKEKPSDMP